MRWRAPRLLIGLLALFAGSSVRAWPVDAYVDLPSGREKIVRLPAANWLEVEDARVATAELLPESGEVLLSGHAPGRTLVLFVAQGRLFAWRIRVGPKAADSPASGGRIEEAQKACPRLEVDGSKLKAQVKDEKCRTALLTLFQTDDFKAADVEVTFEVPALQSQLAALDAALAPLGSEKPTARYLGAGLVLKGSMSEAAHKKALWSVFLNTVGSLAVEDQVEVQSASPQGDPK